MTGCGISDLLLTCLFVLNDKFEMVIPFEMLGIRTRHILSIKHANDVCVDLLADQHTNTVLRLFNRFQYQEF